MPRATDKKRAVPTRGTIVPRRYTPPRCIAACCCIFIVYDDKGAYITHLEERLFIPQVCLDDLTYDIWGKDVKPWLETRHGETEESKEKSGPRGADVQFSTVR